jgi:acetyl/propionyl-CoA carboxylase alpha subunit
VSTDVRLRSAGHVIAVTVAADGEGFDATVDGTPHRVAGVTAIAVASVAGATVDTLDVVIDGVARRAVVARTRERTYVAVAGHSWTFERVDDTHGGGAGGAGSGSVIAPMPGKVVKVLVAVGDAVTAGQALIVVEAMKMETTLVAEIDGRVTTVAAEAGAMVDAGTIVVEIEPTQD